MRIRTLAILLTAAAALAADPATLFDVRAFGAKGDGKTLDTAAIQKAIDACNRSGGGLVVFATGDYLTGTLTLKSNVTLRLSPGATLWGSRDIQDYSPRHLLYARDAQNISIEGGGAINGQGEAFWDKNFKPLTRPSPLIELWGCQDVRIQDVRILNAPGWTVHPKNCRRVKIRGITLVNNMKGLNTDGIDPDSSRDVIISDSYIEAGDDCIVLKTTNRGGPVLPCENVTVTNCVLISSASALKLGTESYADFRHVVFSNCVIRGSRTGIALLNKDGATMEGVSFSNITMQTAPKVGKGVEWPIVIDLEKRTAESRLGRIRDVTLSDIQIYTKGRVMVTSMPESPFDRISFRNVVLRAVGWEAVEKERKLRGGTVQKVAGVIDLGAVPSAFILAHVRNLDLRDVRVDWDGAPPAPERHAVWGDGIDGLRIDGFEGRPSVSGGKLAAIHLKNARNVSITGSRARAGESNFLSLEGSDAKTVVVEK